MRLIDVNFQTSRVGSGHRRFFDVTGPRQKKAQLLYMPTLTPLKCKKSELRSAREVELTPDKAKALAERLRAKTAEFDRLGRRVPVAQVRKVLQELEQVAAS